VLNSVSAPGGGRSKHHRPLFAVRRATLRLVRQTIGPTLFANIWVRGFTLALWLGSDPSGPRL